ncbi:MULTISPECIES: sulfate ABC transporter permease subunit CysT [unclassified Iodidimonas]|uniref:sulfate ABC transporter permease subunit CysT n=1 Tax=unclassified Iodidimonas TaxID=2626145 RepID=UPI002482B1C4|nr:MULTISPECIES: sulfate ABC transporter permease subunit CysT [unclassified Iodidimonas]
MTLSATQSQSWFRAPSILPGFRLTMGVTIFWLGFIVLIPLGALLFKSASLGWTEFWEIAFSSRTLGALKLSFSTAFVAALINGVMGLLLAFVLVRYQFFGKRIIDAAIDLPFALPTAVAGIALATLYGPNGWIGSLLAPLGIKVAYTPLGITIALIFIGLPFVVRTVQPVLEEVEVELEEAAATLGASRFQTITKVILPTVLPALLTGFALALARGVGEYGSVIFIAGNIPYVSEIAPLLIVIRLEEFDVPAATVVAATMLLISFSILLLINLIQTVSRRRFGRG